jgi:hypothetical protein
MVIEIPKGTPEKKVRELLNKKKIKPDNNAVNAFFGKLPKLEDGLEIQKRLRSEWK